jgi:hypothetical protein
MSTGIGVQEVLARLQQQPTLEQEIDEVPVLRYDILPGGSGGICVRETRGHRHQLAQRDLGDVATHGFPMLG